MFKYIVLLCLVMTSLSVAAQISNKDRLNQIEQEIKSAVSNGNYDKANLLKKEKEIRLKIKQAVEAGNFEEAQRLKTQLTNGNSSSNPTPSGNSGIRYEDTSANSPSSNESTQYQASEGGNPMFRMFYLEFGIAGPYSFSGDGIVSGSTSSGILLGGIRIGHVFYFGRKKPGNFKVGIDMNWLEAINANDCECFVAGVLRPGIMVTYAFSEKTAFDAHVNIGYSSITPQDSELQDAPGYSHTSGISFNPGVRFRASRFNTGFDITVASLSNDNSSMTYSSFLFLVGFRF